VATPFIVLVRRSTASTLRTASSALLAGAVTFVPLFQSVGAQVAIKRAPSGFNLLSVEQDLDVGRQSALELERQLSLVTNARTDQFLASIVALLAAHAPGPKFPFRVTTYHSAQINALALPGGPMFVDRSLFALARSEAELASVLAHAMSHVVLRHGTSRASKAYLGKAGLSALGGLAGESTAARVINAVGGFGTSAVFLQFGRSDEYEADALGAELLAKSGYDPVAMATMFATLRRERRRNPGLERFFSSHPSAPDRETRIRNLSNVLARGGSQEVVGGFSRIRWRGGATAAAPQWNTATGTVAPRSAPVTLDVPAPSSRFTQFSHPDASLTIDHPSNWTAHSSGIGVSFAPPGGVVERDNGQPSLLHGVILNYYAPFENDVERWNNSLTRNYAPFEDRTRQRGVLEDATDDLVRQILGAHSWLSAATGSARAEVVDGARGYSVRLIGRSPVTGDVERVTVHTRALPGDQVIYLACVAPGRGASAVERACARMVQSLRVTEAAANRQ
jgi:Zn-dependent protease with chaperone function